MSVNETYVDASPEAVFDVLADPAQYQRWVVGASRTRGAEGDWPEPGSTFRHVQGAFGLGLHDSTSVVTAERPRKLVLEARMRPLAVNKVELRLSPSGRGTKLVMVEYPTGGIAGPLHNPLADLALKLRNVESLRRLRNIVEHERAT